MQKARRHPYKYRLRPLVSARFQVLFHSPVRGAFHLSLTVLVRYRSLSSIQPYQMVLADSDRISRVPPYSGYCQDCIAYLYGTVTLFGRIFQKRSSSKYFSISQPYNPTIAETMMVQAVPCSLATTRGIIIIFFSSAYLDVSVQRVCLQVTPDILDGWVAPFGNLRIDSYLPIPAAYRSLSRPSSPLRAKASSVRPQ